MDNQKNHSQPESQTKDQIFNSAEQIDNQSELTIDGIPFFSQIIHPNTAFGPTVNESKYWTERACGIACIKMLISAAAQKKGESFNKSTWEILNEALRNNAYCRNGWIHSELLKLLGKYSITGRCCRNVATEIIAELLQNKNTCIASVSVGFKGGERDANDHPIGKGGHLVVVHGIKFAGNKIEGVRCHHPSSCPNWNWENIWIPYEQFNRSFSGNLMEIYWPSNKLN